MAGNDLVQEQMGDILSAFDIPDLAKHIVPIPIPLDPIDVDDEEEEDDETKGEISKEKEGEDGKAIKIGDRKGKEGEKEGSDGKEKADEPAKDGSKKGKEFTAATKVEDTKGDQVGGNVAEESPMEIDESTNNSTAFSKNGDSAPSGSCQAETSQDQEAVNQGHQQSVASLQETGMKSKESSMIKELLTESTSKPVMTSRLQDDLSHPPEPLSDVDDDDFDVEEVPDLRSADEFNSWVDRCNEGKNLKEQKLSLLSKTNSILTYRCPTLNKEQLKVLDMGEEIYQCPGCDDAYLFKASLDAHLDRRTVIVTFHCAWCKGRQDLVFYNKCTFRAHLRNHKLTDHEISKARLEASVCPVNALNALKIYTKLTAPRKQAAPRPVKLSTQLTAQPALKPLVQTNATNKNSEKKLFSDKPMVFQTVTPPKNSPTMPLQTNQTAEEEVIKNANDRSSGISPPTFSCMGCCRRYDRLHNLKMHLSRPQPDPTQPGANGLLTCSCCKLVVANRCKLVMHHLIHQRVKDGKQAIPCPECGCLFTDIKSLLIHQNDGCFHWMTRPLFKCSFCTKYATTFAGLVRHLEQNHVGVFYKCPLCQLAFRNNQSASEHSAQVHKMKSVSYGVLRKCPYCKSVYSEKGMLANHFETHYEKGQIKIEKFVFCCPLCVKPFDYGIGLSNHLKNEHGRTKKNMFHCDRCITAFSTIEAVLVHRLTCPNKPTENIRMNQLKVKAPSPPPVHHFKLGKPSGEQFEAPSHPPAHHFKPGKAGGKQFVCAECGERFPYSDLEGLKKHMVEKHNEKMKDSLKQGGNTTNNVMAANKPLNKLENTPEVGRKEFPVTLERFTNLQCGKCEFKTTDRLVFEKHIAGYKTEDSLSQCHECGLCFTVKGSLKKHLFMKHKIKNMDGFNSLCEEFIPKWEDELKKKKQEEKEKESKKASVKEEKDSKAPTAETKDDMAEEEKEEEEEARSFKCKVCKVEFENEKALTVHARSHGLAYLQHTLARSPEKAARMQNSKPPPAPVKEEKKVPEVKPMIIPSDTDSSMSSDSNEASSVEDD